MPLCSTDWLVVPNHHCSFQPPSGWQRLTVPFNPLKLPPFQDLLAILQPYPDLRERARRGHDVRYVDPRSASPSGTLGDGDYSAYGKLEDALQTRDKGQPATSHQPNEPTDGTSQHMTVKAITAPILPQNTQGQFLEWLGDSVLPMEVTKALMNVVDKGAIPGNVVVSTPSLCL